MHMKAFQKDVLKWYEHCFKRGPFQERKTRIHRFVEESLELAQSLDVTEEEVLQLVKYVFNRTKGAPHQEVGGVMTTLAVLCSAHDLDLNQCAIKELLRVYEKVETIRAKDANKPVFSPLPGSTEPVGTSQ